MAASASKRKAAGSAATKPQGNGKSKAPARRARKRGLSFGFLIFVFIFLAGTGVFMLVQRQFAVTCDVKVRKLQAQIDAEKSSQESLRLSIAKLKSPGRIARIAGDEMGLGDPAGIIYLKYAKDASGKMVCASTFEQTFRPFVPAQKPAEQKDQGKTQASIVKAPAVP